MVSGGDNLRVFMRQVTTKATNDTGLHQKGHKTNPVIAQSFLNVFTYVSKYFSARERIYDYPRLNMIIHLHKNGNAKSAFRFLKHHGEELVNMKDCHSENVKFC